MDIVNRRNKSPETRRLVQKYETLTLPVVARKILYFQSKRNVFVHFIEINDVANQQTSYEKLTEECIKKSNLGIRVDLKSSISKTASERETTSVRSSMRSEEKETVTDGY